MVLLLSLLLAVCPVVAQQLQLPRRSRGLRLLYMSLLFKFALLLL